MPALKLRDRDAIITREDLIFRVLGYSHSPTTFFCDVEYGPSTLFKSSNPKALRTRDRDVFYKFYEDEGWKFIQKNSPQYLVFHIMLRRKIVGVSKDGISEVRKPDETLERLVLERPADGLIVALQGILEFMIASSTLAGGDFGVFGSVLHGFHHPKLSDIDLVIYGREQTLKLRQTLQELYADRSSPLANEFETEEPVKGKPWHFRRLSLKEYMWHQRRKTIYAVLNNAKSGRKIKTEFEPVKTWREIRNDYSSKTRIAQKGWVRMLARVTNDDDAPFIPSVYGVEPLEVFAGPREASDVGRIISYMEEFRLQACKGEKVYVEGNLEKVTADGEDSYQVALTYCPAYYEQVMKVVSQT